MNNRGGPARAGRAGSRAARLSSAHLQRNRNPNAQDPDIRGPQPAYPSGDDGLHRRSRKLPADLVLQISTSPIDERGNGRTAGGTFASRPAFTELQLDKAYQTRMEPGEEKAHVKYLMDERNVGKEPKTKRTIALGCLKRTLPFVSTLRNYKMKEYGHFDLVSGISIGLLLIPQSIAYSLLANVRPQHGFYSAFFAMIVYFFMGSSKHLNLTNQGAVSLLVGEAVRAGMEQVYPNGAGLCGSAVAASAVASDASLIPTTPSSAVLNSTANCLSIDDANARIALTLTMLAGALQVSMGILQLGFITIYLPDPLNAAFACAAAMHICVGQLGNLLGAPIPSISGNGKFFVYLYEAGKAIVASRIHVPTIIVASFSFLTMLAVKIFNDKCIKRIRIPIPIDTIVLIAGLLLSKFLDWGGALKMATVGEIRKGFETPHAPLLEHFSTGSGIIVNGLVLGIISYAMSISLAKTFALRNGYEVDANQELLAYGIANFGTCWFGTFVSAAAIASTSMHESMKGRTQVYSVYATFITLLAILVFAPEFSPVPKGVLAAIIVVNMKNMVMQVEQLPVLFRTNKYDFAIFLVTLLANLCLDLPIGLGIGVMFSVATVIYRTQAPKAFLLGRLPDTDIYRSIKKHKKAVQIPGLKIFKFDGSVYYASAENFRTRLYRKVAMNPKKILVRAKARAKLEGRPSGELDLRTDILRSDEIRQILETVTEEGGHPIATARLEAQMNIPVHKLRSPFVSLTNLYELDVTKTPSIVNVFCIILDLSSCAFTDAVGIRLLSQIVDDFNKIGVEIYLSGVAGLVRSQLRKANFYAKRSEEGLFVTVHDAVVHALSALYMELLEDEAQQRQEEPESGTLNSDIARTSENNTADEASVLSKPRSTTSEVGRERRRHSRRETLHRDSVSSSVSREASQRMGSYVSREASQRVGSYVSREASQRLDVTQSGKGLPILMETPDQPDGVGVHSLAGVVYADTAGGAANGTMPGRAHNPGFRHESTF